MITGSLAMLPAGRWRPRVAYVPLVGIVACLLETENSVGDAVVIGVAGDGRLFQTTAVLTVTVTDTPGLLIDGFRFVIVPESGSGTLQLLPEGDADGVAYSISFPSSLNEADETGDSSWSYPSFAGATWVSYTEESYVRQWVYVVVLESEGSASVRVKGDVAFADHGCSAAEDYDAGISMVLTDITTGAIDQ